MTEDPEKNRKNNPVIICDPEGMENLVFFSCGKSPEGQPDDEDTQSQKENKLYDGCNFISPGGILDLIWSHY